MNKLLLPLISLALAACAATPAKQKPDPTAAADADTICVREARTGTSLPTTRCRTAEQRAANQEAITRVEEARRNFTGLVTAK